MLKNNNKLIMSLRVCKTQDFFMRVCSAMEETVLFFCIDLTSVIDNMIFKLFL